MSSTDSKPITCNVGAFYLQPRSISVIMIQTPTDLNTQCIYALNTSLAVYHKINHKYPKSLSIPILNTTYNRVCIPRATVFSTLNPIEIESTEVSNISWTKKERSQDYIRNSPTELPTIPTGSSFQLE